MRFWKAKTLITHNGSEASGEEVLALLGIGLVVLRGVPCGVNVSKSGIESEAAGAPVEAPLPCWFEGSVAGLVVAGVAGGGNGFGGSGGAKRPSRTFVTLIGGSVLSGRGVGPGW